jgi:hypothetical protein
LRSAGRARRTDSGWARRAGERRPVPCWLPLQPADVDLASFHPTAPRPPLWADTLARSVARALTGLTPSQPGCAQQLLRRRRRHLTSRAAACMHSRPAMLTRQPSRPGRRLLDRCSGPGRDGWTPSAAGPQRLIHLCADLRDLDVGRPCLGGGVPRGRPGRTSWAVRGRARAGSAVQASGPRSPTGATKTWTTRPRTPPRTFSPRVYATPSATRRCPLTALAADRRPAGLPHHIRPPPRSAV